MTTQSWSTKVRHDSDAEFRLWGSELNTKLAAVGLVQTADTGQINWVTVVRAGVNSEAGYEIWRMNDTLQGTAPVFLRIGYGTATAVNNPRIQITLGTGSDGAGVITGTALTIAQNINGSAGQTTETARQSYLCVVDGFIGLNWKTGAGASEAFFAFCRTVNSNGTPSATGGMVVWGSGTTAAVTATQALRFAATAQAFVAKTSLADSMLGFSPQAPVGTLVGADNQAMLAWTITPQVAPLVGVCGVLSSEVTTGNTFLAALVGSTLRTYIGLTTVAGAFGPSSAGSNNHPKFAMLWE